MQLSARAMLALAIGALAVMLLSPLGARGYLVNALTSTAARNTLANIRPSGFAGPTWNVDQIFYTVPFR